MYEPPRPGYPGSTRDLLGPAAMLAGSMVGLFIFLMATVWVPTMWVVGATGLLIVLSVAAVQIRSRRKRSLTAASAEPQLDSVQVPSVSPVKKR